MQKWEYVQVYVKTNIPHYGAVAIDELNKAGALGYELVSTSTIISTGEGSWWNSGKIVLNTETTYIIYTLKRLVG